MKNTTITTQLLPLQPQTMLKNQLTNAQNTLISIPTLAHSTPLITPLCSKMAQNQPKTSFFTPSKASLGLLNQSNTPIYPIWHSKNQVANSPQIL